MVEQTEHEMPDWERLTFTWPDFMRAELQRNPWVSNRNHWGYAATAALIGKHSQRYIRHIARRLLERDTPDSRVCAAAVDDLVQSASLRALRYISATDDPLPWRSILRFSVRDSHRDNIRRAAQEREAILNHVPGGRPKLAGIVANRTSAAELRRIAVDGWNALEQLARAV